MNNGTMNMRGALNRRQHLLYVRLLFPKRLAHFGEEVAPPQFRRVLIDRRGRIVVLRRAVAEQNQRGGGEIFPVHAEWLAEPTPTGKPPAEKS